MKLISPDEEASTQETCTPNDPQNEDQKPTPEGTQENGKGMKDTPKIMEGKTNNVNVHLRGANPIQAHNLHVNDVHKKCIIDNGADTSVLGQGWKVIEQTTRKANVIGFDTKVAVKKNLPIVTAVAAVDLKNNETICSQKSKYSLIHSNSGLGDWGAILLLGFCMTSLTLISRRENVCYQLHVIAFAIMQMTICNYRFLNY